MVVPPDNPDDPNYPDFEYTLLCCTNCREASLQVREHWVFDTPNEIPKFVYPARRQLSTDVPAELRREFEEARTCFEAKAYTATVVMVRRTLEGIGVDNDINDRPLARQIERMKTEGLIDNSIAEWADSLRALGNQGAHFTGRQVSREDANDALDFAEALLDHIYVYKKRFEEFRKRNEAKPASPPVRS
ncbi:protein of unknown function [Micromonospora echinaurantiaca]|uniref:DUF4145 domain-containing protein n=1 Tax=Micromonospora echinaurantiaca TaxID=47857 RepID=A0A1C5K046_9ACTN|nr:protein of unknown function [Micromonospora echinaurantiaca]